MSPKSIWKARTFLELIMICHSKCEKKNSTKFLEKSCQLARERRDLETRKEGLDQLSAAGEDVVDGVMAVDASL